MTANLNAIKIRSNIYLAKVKAIRKSYFVLRISEAWLKKLNCSTLYVTYPELVTVTGLPVTIPCDQFAAF